MDMSKDKDSNNDNNYERMVCMLEKILRINWSLTSIENRDYLLKNILKSLIDTTNMDRGIIYVNSKEKGLLPEVYVNITESEIVKEYFRVSKSSVLESCITQKIIQESKKMKSNKDSSFHNLHYRNAWRHLCRYYF